MDCYPEMWELLLQRISQCICVPNVNETNIQCSENLIQSLLYLLNATCLLETTKGKPVLAKKLIKLSNDVEKHLKDGPLDRLGGKLKIEMEILIGKEEQ